jgi:hypothetical protein
MMSILHFDVTHLVQFTGVFEPLRDPARFGQTRVHLELATV